MSLKMMEQKLLDWVNFLVPISYQLKISLQAKKDREPLSRPLSFSS